MKRALALLGAGIFLAIIAPMTVSALPDTPFLPTSQPTFDPLTATCLGIAAPDPTTATPLAACGGGQNLALSANPEVNSAIQLYKGRPLTLPFAYSGPGWRTLKDDAGITDPLQGKVIGGVRSVIDLFCDGQPDLFQRGAYPAPAPAPPAVAPEYYWKTTTAWGTGTEVTFGGYPDYRNKDGSYLDNVVPPPAVASRVTRARADITKLYINTDGTGIASGTVTLVQPTPLNQIILHPKWSPEDLTGVYSTTGSAGAPGTEAGTTLSITNLGGGASVPSTQLLCLQAPQHSTATYPGLGTTGCSTAIVSTCGVFGNPVACATPNAFCGAGWYVRWTTFLSAPDITSNAQQFVVVPQRYCISAGTEAACIAAHTDTDKDGLESCVTALGADAIAGHSTNIDGVIGTLDYLGAVRTAGGRPCELPANDSGAAVTCPANPIVPVSTTADRQCSGLLDGIKVAWGANPNLIASDIADAGGSGKRDIEKMLGPGYALTNPTKKDTDLDGVKDGGLNIIDGSGTYDTNLVFHGSIPRDPVSDALTVGNPDCTPGPCLSNGLAAVPWSGDNCPNISNPLQTNTRSGRLGYAIGDPGTGWAGQAVSPTPGGIGPVRVDRTNPVKGFLGDACESDINHDFIPDLAEATVRTKGPPSDDCNVIPPAGDPAPTSAGAPPLLVASLVHMGGTTSDNDGDRVLNGRECQLGSPPQNNGYTSPPFVGFDSGNVSCGGCTPEMPTIGTKLPSFPGAQSNDWSSYMRITNIGTAAGGIACGTGMICNPSNFADPAPCGNPCRTDSDGDLIPDAVETYVWGTNPANADSDRDGCSDTVEIIAVDGTTKVSGGSLAVFAAHWGAKSFAAVPRPGTPFGSATAPDPTWDPIVDYAGARIIGGADLGLFAPVWNMQCAPGPGQLSP